MEGKRRIDRITDDGYLDELAARPLTDIRSMREESVAEEALLSYERRLLHGRLAILRAEIDRRSGKTEGSLVEQLPKILADEGRGPSRGQFPRRDPRIDFDQPKRRVSRLIADDTLANLAAMDDAALQGIVTDLEDAEQESSSTRRKVLDVVDALNAELGRRYKSGEADPSDVLSRDA